MANTPSTDIASDAKTSDAATLEEDAELELVDRWWRAANYLSVGQIYLRSNPMLRKQLRVEDTKSRLLGHWGTTPGLNFVYAHLNRVIRRDRQEILFIAGPGHGGPAVVANAWLEGTYSEIYSNVGEDEPGLAELFRQFSYPGGIPSHAAPETPGSISEGGELGYSLAHAYGSVFDNPKEEGTTTTPFDMAMLNGIDRFQLAIDAIDRVPGLAERHSLLRQALQDRRIRAHNHTRTHGEDLAEISDWSLNTG